jgi:hypothetical protein
MAAEARVWARLGISKTDVEWFLSLNAVGTITIGTSYQEKRMHPSNGHQIMAGDRMLRPHQSVIHPDRGIRQENTPSTLIFIAVFDILLTLLDTSNTGVPQAYADDLEHLSKTLTAQQRQADLYLRCRPFISSTARSCTIYPS